MANPLIDKILPKITEAQTALDNSLETLNPEQIKDIMTYNATQLKVSAAVGFLSKGMGAKLQDINKATQ